MFENYSSEVQIGHDCDCHKPSEIIPEEYTPARITRDELGNITKLQWAPDARFTINLTSDTNISIIEGSQILSRSGLTPENIAGWEGLYAYNIVDTICWQYRNGTWNKLPNIITSNRNSVVITFGNDQAITKVSIKNFRGATIFSDTEEGNFVPLTIDDNLASVLMQGFYYVDIYQVTTKSTKLIRRIPLSVGHAQPDKKPPIHPSTSCHNNKGFATDNTLTLRNGVLSVNVDDQCQMGGTLPISSNAVFEYAQPRNMIVEADVETNVATMTAADIYSYQLFGGDAICLVNGIYLVPFSITPDKATFKDITLNNSTIISHVLSIDNTGKILEFKKTEAPINAAEDLNNFQDILAQQMSTLALQHAADIERMDGSIAGMDNRIQAMQEQIGDLKVTEKIVELYNNYNNLNTRLNGIDSELNSKIEESDISKIVEEKVAQEVTDDKLEELVNNAVSENIKLDGGVIE